MLFSLITLSFAHTSNVESLKFEDGFIRYVPKSRGVSAAFVKIKNISKKDVEIVKIESEIFEDIEMHTHAIVDGVMKMREVDSMIIKANAQRILKSKSDHIMFFGFKKELVLGEKIPLKFTFKDKHSQIGIFEVKK